MKLTHKMFGIVIASFSIHTMASSSTSAALGEGNTANQHTTSNHATYPNELLDEILKCADYAYQGNYFNMPYHGCNYTGGEGNKLGQAEVYLTPKKESLQEINLNIDQEEKKLNSLDIIGIKKNYNTYISIIDKKFLSYHKDGELPYSANPPYEELFFENTTGKWKVVTWRKVNNHEDSAWDRTWRESYIINNSIAGKKKNEECIDNLRTLALSANIPLHGVKPEHVKVHINDYDLNTIKFGLYFLTKNGFEGNKYDKNKPSGSIAFLDFNKETLDFDIAPSDLNPERKSIPLFNMNYAKQLADCDFILDLFHRPNDANMKVISNKRTYFYGQPDNETRTNNLFLIPGDNVKPYLRVGDFISVTYTQKSGNVIYGWLKTEDLMEIPSLD